MEFKPFHKDYFKAINGAYSRVTERENYDSQITLTDIEAETVINFFGITNIHIGNVDSNPQKSAKPFLLYPNFTPIVLNLVFPKPHKTELRLYLSKRAGYKPEGGEIWFIYENSNHQLVVGSLNEKVWNGLGQADQFDDRYQSEIESDVLDKGIPDKAPEGKISTISVGGRVIYQRDPLIAAVRFKASNYSCEMDPAHKTFISQKTSLPYIEAHHFIPIKFQPIFDKPLDDFDNIFSLCPNCHKKIHYAIIEEKFEMVKFLYQKRPGLNTYELDYIAQFYNCLKIVPAT